MNPSDVIGQTWTPVSDTRESEPLDPSTQLAQTKQVSFVREDHLVRKIDLGGRIASLDTDSSERVTALLDRLDGKKSLRDVAHELSWDVDETVENAQQLYELAVLETTGDTRVPAPTFFRHVAALGTAVQSRIVASRDAGGRLLERMMTRRSSRRLLLGYFVEAYHIIMGASIHMSPTINLAPNLRLRMMLCEFLRDEYWHGIWLRRGLNSAGITEAEIDRADPLPATIAALDRLRATSSTDLLAYAAAISTGERAGEAEIERIRRRYEALMKDSNLPKELVVPFREHEIADCNLAHGSFCAEFYADEPPLSRERQLLIRRSMLMYLRCLEQQQHQVEAFYGDDPDGPAVYSAEWTPRPRSPIPDLSVDEVKQRLSDGVWLYDCSVLASYRAGHVPGAVWIDPAYLSETALPEDPNAISVFYCSGPTCMACENGARRAMMLGARNVFTMRAGIAGWREHRLPVIENAA